VTTLERSLRTARSGPGRTLHPRSKVRGYVLVTIAIVVFAFMPALVPEYQLIRLTDVAIASIAAAALCLLTGKAGQVSLGTSAFIAVGAYTSVSLSRWFGIGFVPAILIAFVDGAIFGLALGLPTLRLRGFYLALTTLAFQFAVTFFATRWQAKSSYGAAFQLDTAHIGGFAVDTERKWYWVALAAAVISLWIMRNLSESAIGRAWRAVRDHEQSAASSGIAAARYKILAFVASSAFTAVAGVFSAYHLGIVSSDQFTLDVTVSYVAMVIIGGLDSLVGAVIGALIVTELPYWIQSVTAGPIADSLGTNIFEVQQLVYGAIIVLFLILAPHGLAGLIRQAWDSAIGRFGQVQTFQRASRHDKRSTTEMEAGE
jgi:branched-chain amino acid transport system permease protein